MAIFGGNTFIHDPPMNSKRTTLKALTKSHDWDGGTIFYDTNRNLYRSLTVVYIPQLFVYDRKSRQIHSHTSYSAGDEPETVKITKNNQ